MVAVWGLPAALWMTVRFADRLPRVVGAKATETAQLLLSGTVFPEQLSAVTGKSPGVAPPMVAEGTLTGEPGMFGSGKVGGLLGGPTGWAPEPMLAGVRLGWRAA